MNEKFNSFGVYIEHMVVMTVVVPQDLNQTLHQSTSYDVQIQKAMKAYTNKKLKDTNREN